MSVGFTCRAVTADKHFVKQMIRMLGEEKRYEVRQEEDYMRVRFCRLGDLFFQFRSGLDGEIPAEMVYGECTSSLAGAGFHAAAVHFVEELARETGLDFILEDETGYGEDHDFERMREDCSFMPGSRSEADEKLNGRIIGELEKALLLDRSLPFPIKEYEMLCRLNRREPMETADVPVSESDYPIGYRRGEVREKLGNMTFVVPGWYLSEYDEDGNSHVWFDSLGEDWHAVRITAFKSREETPEITERIFEDAEGEARDGENGCLKYRFAFAGTQVDEPDGVYCQYVGEAVGGYQIALITASCQHRDDEWAEAFFKSLNHVPEIDG